MLVAGIAVVVIIVAGAATLLSRRHSHDDEHSVEGYHRQLHTLEGMGVHPAGSGLEPAADGEGADHPERAVRITGSTTVRLTDADHRIVPPVPPPPLASLGEPVRFDDTPATPTVPGVRGWGDDRTMQAINRRPRRLAGPAMAVAAVIVLIAVLLVTGSHKVPPAHRGHNSSAATTASPGGGRSAKVHHRTKRHATTTTTTTTAPLVISSAQNPTANGATYVLADDSYSLLVGATTGPCWLDVQGTQSGTTLFTGVLEPGQQHTIAATGQVTIVIGAPSVATVDVDGKAAVLPPGFQTPFTVRLVPFPSPSP
jgi:hypothetical protein